LFLKTVLYLRHQTIFGSKSDLLIRKNIYQMLENLIKLVKEQAGEAIINNPAIPNEHNDAACETTAGSIIDSLKGLTGSGDLSGIISLFQGGGSSGNSNVVSNITSNVAGDLMKRFGLDTGAASGIVQSLIPDVLNKLVSKTNDPEDKSFDLQDILGTLTGGQPDGNQGSGGGILNAIKGLFGR
jgi:hypothetical protein